MAKRFVDPKAVQANEAATARAKIGMGQFLKLAVVDAKETNRPYKDKTTGKETTSKGLILRNCYGDFADFFGIPYPTVGVKSERKELADKEGRPSGKLRVVQIYSAEQEAQRKHVWSLVSTEAAKVGLREVRTGAGPMLFFPEDVSASTSSGNRGSLIARLQAKGAI
jgi:hypothetical protein